jgi:hypothetical protein
VAPRELVGNSGSGTNLILLLISDCAWFNVKRMSSLLCACPAAAAAAAAACMRAQGQSY